jgi:hypothetical protein
MDAELEEFKRLDLRAYAASLGYTLDRQESWRGSAVMRNAADDKIIIKRENDGHYVYFNVRDDADNGTIIDFALRRKCRSLGGVRKEPRNSETDQNNRRDQQCPKTGGAFICTRRLLLCR